MADPGTLYGNRKTPTHGAGPYQFDVGALDPGNSFRINFREYEEHGTKGYYTTITEVGFNSVTIDNQSGEPLVVTINENNKYPVVPNQSRSLSQEGIYDVRVANNGGATIADGDVTFTVSQSGYDGDTRAREMRKESPVRRVIRNFTGI